MENPHKPDGREPADPGMPSLPRADQVPSLMSVAPEEIPNAGDDEVIRIDEDIAGVHPQADQAAAGRSRPGAKMVEIRVHGVSGTPPQDVLCSQWAVQVAGDAQAPIFQPADQFGRTILGPELRTDSGPVTRQTEAYHWGEMTSGGWRKAIWAVLLPFALINVARWMLPPEHGRIGQVGLWLVKATLRLAGLLFTCLFMAQAAVLVMDVIVVQCSGTPGICLSSVNLGWLWSHQRVLSIAGGLALIALLGIIDQISLVRWKPTCSLLTSGASGGDLAGDDSFYVGDVDAPWLRVVHLTGGLSVVVVLLLGGLHPQPSGWQQLVWIVAVVLLAGCAIAAFILADPRKPRPSSRQATVLMWVTPCVPMGLLVLTSVAGPTAFAVSGAPASLPGSDAVVGLLMIVLFVVTVVFAAALVVVRIGNGPPRDTPGSFRPFALGLFAVPVAALGSLLGAGLGVGYTNLVATCLTSACNPKAFVHVNPAKAPLKLPIFYGSVSELWAVAAGIAAAGGILLALWFLGKAAMAVFWAPPSLAPAILMQAPPRAQRFGVTLAWQLARWRLLSARAVTVLSLAMAGASLLCLEALWIVAGRPESLNPVRFLLDRGFLAKPASALGLVAHFTFLANAGVIVLLLVTFALLSVVYSAARRPDSARSLGILWDLASYWPRSAHPFVPPCYAQKAVPELVERAHDYIQHGYQVVLSAHSQGSLLTVAAALRMNALHKESCDHLGLVMAGSQLQWAYPRAFPAVVSPSSYSQVLQNLEGRWYVLVRGTDPLGGPVLSWNARVDGTDLGACGFAAGRGGDQAHLRSSGSDPWILGHDHWIRDPMHGKARAIGQKLNSFSLATERHSGYWSAPDWDKAVALAMSSMPAAGSSGADRQHA